MTAMNFLTKQPINPASLRKRMLWGAGIGLILILSFILRVNHPRPEWGELWMIRPLIVTPLAGAMAGAVYYFINHLPYPAGWMKTLATIFSLMVYIIALWMGIVLGLVGTLWH